MRLAALLRGVAPSDPRMRNDRLRAVLESLGHTGVRPVISSGNVLFDAAGEAEGSAAGLAEQERTIEEAFGAQLGVAIPTLLRPTAVLAALIGRDPFAGLEHGRSSYLTVTFLKTALPDAAARLAEEPQLATTTVLGVDQEAAAVLTVTDTTAARTPDMMLWLERRLGKGITTRTWNTVRKLVAIG